MNLSKPSGGKETLVDHYRNLISNGDLVEFLMERASTEADAEDITALIEALEGERDEARKIVADCNNSLFGSHGYFTQASGKTAAAAIEDLKRYGGDQWQRAERAEASLAKADAILSAVSQIEGGDSSAQSQPSGRRADALSAGLDALRSAALAPIARAISFSVGTISDAEANEAAEDVVDTLQKMGALNEGEEFLEFKEALSDLRSLRAEHRDLNGGGPGWMQRWLDAWVKADDLFANEDEAAWCRQQEDAHG